MRYCIHDVPENVQCIECDEMDHNKHPHDECLENIARALHNCDRCGREPAQDMEAIGRLSQRWDQMPPGSVSGTAARWGMDAIGALRALLREVARLKRERKSLLSMISCEEVDRRCAGTSPDPANRIKSRCLSCQLLVAKQERDEARELSDTSVAMELQAQVERNNELVADRDRLRGLYDDQRNLHCFNCGRQPLAAAREDDNVP